MADGVVQIDVKLMTNSANASAKALKGTLTGVDIKADAAQHIKELEKTLKSAAGQAKETAASSKQLGEDQSKASDGAKKLSEEERKAAEEAKKTKTAQDGLKSSLSAQSQYWSQLADGQEKAGLATAAGISKYNSLKAQLGSVNVETEQAKAKMDQLTESEGYNSKNTQEAANAYVQLMGKQAGLSAQVEALGKKYGGLTPQMALAADKAKAIGDRFQSTGQKISAVGSKMTLGFTTPIVAGLAYAGKAAVDFDGQIQSMGPLLDDGTVSAATLKAELDHLGTASKNWSVQYGVSTSSINDGMSELIKKGYTYNQVLGAMPSILDATKASGEDFNSVMSVSTSTLEQFGLKSNNTAQMLKNTQRVTDSLSFVANKTSAGFGDMGNAMEYVGPVAHGLGMSLEQTASMIGLMSNQGIEGEKAGTALRGALSALLTPSRQNIAGFKALGVSVADFKKGTLTMPQILDNIKAKSKDMTKQQLQSNLALAFGTEAQTGMNILVNEGGDALRRLTGETQKSTGYTKKLAETMNNTSKANVDKFKESLNTLAITFGSKLLPEITNLVNKGTDLVKWFANLNDGTQKTIISTAAAVAAAGPLLSVIGKTSGGIGSLFHGIQKANLFLGKFGPGAKLASDGAEKVGEKAVEAGTKTGLFGQLTHSAALKLTAMAGAEGVAEGGSVSLLGALLPFAPAIIGVGAAVTLGIFAWEKWGKSAAASAARTKKWGTDIGATADHAATKFEGFETKVTTSLNDTTSSAKQNAADIDSAFGQMLKSATSNVKKAQVELAKVAKDFGGSLGKDILSGGKSTQNGKNDALADMVSYYNQAKSITKQASQDNKKLTADQKVEIANLQTQMAAGWVKTLNISQKQQKQVLKVMQGDFKGMSSSSLYSYSFDIQQGLEKSAKMEASKMKELKALHDKGLIDDQMYYRVKAKQQDAYFGTNKKAMESDVRAQLEAFHKSDQYRQMDANNRKTNDAALLNHEKNYLTQTLGLSDKQAAAILKAAQSTQKAANTTAIALNGLSGKTKKAAEDWNGIVLDPKTGKVKTNAVEEVAKAVKSSSGWNKIKLLEQKGKMSTNATETVAKATIANKQWANLKWLVANAKLNDETKQATITAMANNGQWNTSDWITAQLLAVSKTGGATIQSLADMNKWDGLSPKVQQLIASSKTKADTVRSLMDVGAWNKLPVSVKKLLSKDVNVAKVTGQANRDVAGYNKNNPNEKRLKAHDQSVRHTTVSGEQSLNAFAKNNPKSKNLKAHYSETNRSTVMDGISSFLHSAKNNVTKYFTAVFSAKKSNKRLGTNYFQGGLATVNDAVGADYRELIHLPSGQNFSFMGRNVTVPLPVGTQILTAQKSKPLLDSVPHFANGTEGGLNDLFDNNGVISISAEMASSFQPTQSQLTLRLSATENDALKSMSDTLSSLAQFVQSFVQTKGSTPDILQIQTVANIDGTIASKKMAKPMQMELNRISRVDSRRRGFV